MQVNLANYSAADVTCNGQYKLINHVKLKFLNSVIFHVGLDCETKITLYKLIILNYCTCTQPILHGILRLALMHNSVT